MLSIVISILVRYLYCRYSKIQVRFYITLLLKHPINRSDVTRILYTMDYTVCLPPNTNYTCIIPHPTECVHPLARSYLANSHRDGQAELTWLVVHWVVVEADTINTFTNQLDKHCINQEVFLDYKVDLTGTGGLPICI